jgi:tRNA threonylcarbamoyladenosine biosynthesis protein TsaB
MLLALETSAERGGVALFDEAVLVGEADVPERERHAASLLVCLDSLLARLGRKLDDVEKIALAIGPGSFTGLRIGLSTALGLCFGTQRKIVPVPTLQALAFQAQSPLPCAPLLDARRGEVYAGLYDPSLEPVLPDACTSLGEWVASLPVGGPLALCGSGARLYRSELASLLGSRAQFLADSAGELRARAVGALAHRLSRAGADLEPERVELRYLRRAEAEAKRLALQGNGEPIPLVRPR